MISGTDLSASAMTETDKAGQSDERYIKCVVWDLDNTLWQGVLLEQDNLRLRDKVVEIIQTLDSRGILQSVASKNDHDLAMAKLREFGLADYFIYPQISWDAKSVSIKAIADLINIGIDSILFIDAQPFELDEARHSLPGLRCFDADRLEQLPDAPGMKPRFITLESKMRRAIYINDARRKAREEAFIGPKEEFLRTLDMVFTLSHASQEDLRRAEELTIRTNQLNTTGTVYSYEELDYFRCSEAHTLLVARLEDKYGAYGTIGLALAETQGQALIIKLLLMSCRVISRGVGSILLGHLMSLARQKGLDLLAEFVPSERNRLMYMTFKFAGFHEVENRGGVVRLASQTGRVPPCPDYVKVVCEE